MRLTLPWTVTAVLSVTCGYAAGGPPPIEAFARSPATRDVQLSPDGHYLSLISEVDGKHVVVVQDRVKGGPAKPVLWTADTNPFDVEGCSWANASRLLCGFIGAGTQDAYDNNRFSHVSQRTVIYGQTRLVAVNADGTEMKVLVQNSYAGISQVQDRVLDWTPAEPDTVLIELDDVGTGFPSVFELNVYTGKLTRRVPSSQPIRSFKSNGRGEIRLGVGIKNDDTHISYYARLAGESEWRLLKTVEAFARPDTLVPLRVTPGKNLAWAVGDANGRQALWELDLEDKQPPRIVFQDPQVDVEDPIFAGDGRLLGVYYESDRPHAYYTDPRARSVIEGTNKFLEGTYNAIYDVTPDEKVYVIRAHSDVDAGSFHLLDVSSGKGELQYLGTAYPELAKYPLARLKSIEYEARDGTKISGYLTVPVGAEEKDLPLIVMPHGGPIARDSWDFDFLRLFLASRGYAVLQMNFRGSGGFGWEWFHAAHQDWGGLTYDDIVDGARWALSKGIADPKRVCIVGWSFGGYAAMLGAVRNSDLFRCSVSIAGVSDLPELLMNAHYFSNEKLERAQLGSNWQKLRDDSPARHAEQVNIPMLLIHGTSDWTVPVGHTERMAAALKRAGKKYEVVTIPRGDHQLGWRSERVTLLTAVEKFLAANLATAAH